MAENELELTINPGSEKQFVQDLNLEMEALQGKREVLPSGQIRLTMTLSDEKAQIMHKLCLRIIARPNDISPN